MFPASGAGILACRSSKEGVSRLRSLRLRPSTSLGAGSGRIAEEVVPSSTARVVGHFGNGKLTPSPVAPATGRLCHLSARRQVPAYRRQAAGLSDKINIVKLTHYPARASLARRQSVCYFHPFGLR